MTVIEQRLRFENIEKRARQLDPLRVLQTILCTIPYILGWVIGKTLKILWFAVAFIWEAGVVGYKVSRGELE